MIGKEVAAMSLFHLFPYSIVDKGSKIILVGAGEVGQCFAEQIVKNNYCKIVAISDRNYRNCAPVCGFNIIETKRIEEYQFDKIVVSVGDDKKNSVLSDLQILGVDPGKIISENYIYYHLQYPWPPPIETTEAIIMKGVFDAIGITKPSYIDVGACHPHMSSNTMLFYANGSRGINIEPNILLKEEFMQYRPEDINLFIGVAANKGTGRFYQCEDPYLSSFSLDAVEYSHIHKNADYTGSVLVPVMTLNEVVDEYCNGVFPDFIDIDIEGMDADVLKSLDVSRTSPKLICVEGDVKIFNDILVNKESREGGYLPYCRITYNTIYLRKDIYMQVLSVGE